MIKCAVNQIYIIVLKILNFVLKHMNNIHFDFIIY